MTDPISTAISQLTELRAAVDVDTDRSFDSASSGGKTLRESFILACKKLGHEFVRFTLVLRATNADVSALADVLPCVAEASVAVVAGVQLLAKTGVGATVQGDIRKYGRSLAQAVLDSVAPIAAVSSGSLSSAIISSQCQRMLHRAGIVLQIIEHAERLPVSNIAAIRRRILLLGKLAKTSADDIAREQDEPCFDEDDEGGDDDEDTKAPNPEILESGTNALRSLALTLRTVVALFDAVSRDVAGSADSIASASSCDLSAAASSGSDWSDRVAVACDNVKESVVDFASAISDSDCVVDTTVLLQNSTSVLVAICQEQSVLQSEIVAQIMSLWEEFNASLSRVKELSGSSDGLLAPPDSCSINDI